MRYAGISACLIALSCLLPMRAMAFEIEEQTLFNSQQDEPETVLRVISTADTELFAPIIHAFQSANPGVAVDYTTASSTELMRAVHEEGAGFDIAISSAMDLQTKLANDGKTTAHSSDATRLLPDWGRWRDHVFSFTQEPATIVIAPSAFEGLEIPRTRQSLLTLLRENPDRFNGRIGTYDVRDSGLGYLFATQDSRTSEIFWRLTEVMGGLAARLYCCSGQMIDDVDQGHIAVAYNVLGSYAQARRAAGARIQIIEPEDFTTVMLRSAVIPVSAENPDLGRQFIDHLILTSWTDAGEAYDPFPRFEAQASPQDTYLRPIRLGPGLLVFLDSLKRDRFLTQWEDSIDRR